MEDISTKSVLNSASILTVGSGWFPTTPGGMERYIYELIHKLAINQDQIELCGVGLPEQEDISIANIRLHNLASPHSKIWQRLWSIRSNFRQINLNHFDAVSLHFALYSFPILDLLPKSLPITFNFHEPFLMSFWVMAMEAPMKAVNAPV